MRGPSNLARHTRRLAWALSIGALSSGAVAAGASAASLSIKVPSTVKKGKGYRIAVSGTFRKSQVHNGRAYLISVIQFAAIPCKSTMQKEYAWSQASQNNFIQFYLSPNDDPSKGTGPGIFKSKSPFTQTNGFTARSTGTRHVCAYLYPTSISPSSRVGPLARADKKYHVGA